MYTRWARRARIIIGYWDYRDADGVSVTDATSAGADDRVVTTLSDAAAEIEAALTQDRAGAGDDATDGSGLKALTGP